LPISGAPKEVSPIAVAETPSSKTAALAGAAATPQIKINATQRLVALVLKMFMNVSILKII
jgi:hypothetical protein